MEFSARQIAELLGGTIEGDNEVTVSNLSKIEEGTPGTLTFLANPAYTHFIYTTGASLAIVRNNFTPDKPLPKGLTLIRVEDPYNAFARILEIHASMTGRKSGISAQSFVSATATLGKDLYIGEFAFLGDGVTVGDGVQIYPQVYLGDNVKVGSGTILYPGVRVYHHCIIGKDCTIHGGAVIGSDGFGFAPQDDKNYRKVPQVGNVILEDNVEIGANTTIDRATIGSTILRRGVKLDNLIQVAHNVEIGENTVIAAQSGLSGSMKVGKNVMVGGQVGFVGHIAVADNVKVGARSGVENSLTQDGGIYFGAPAIDAMRARKNYVHWRNLDDIVRKLNTLEKQVKKLTPDE
ncbi:MAG: UDP-3-O-(3-hydroxymyristoyl)glucosamine N-acyltransferase [Bacteroidales bacterium]|nr:UDP-3-O-(3-hydroxymyristoyl)glucosamine N-acyltransferase [Bacteroidales bacterium]